MKKSVIKLYLDMYTYLTSLHLCWMVKVHVVVSDVTSSELSVKTGEKFNPSRYDAVGQPHS